MKNLWFFLFVACSIAVVLLTRFCYSPLAFIAGLLIFGLFAWWLTRNTRKNYEALQKGDPDSNGLVDLCKYVFLVEDDAPPSPYIGTMDMPLQVWASFACIALVIAYGYAIQHETRIWWFLLSAAAGVAIGFALTRKKLAY